MADFITELGFLLVIAGIADAILSKTSKKAIADWILSPRSAHSGATWISDRADRWFGPRLFSIRSAIRSVIFTFCALFSSVILAGFPRTAFIRELFQSLFQNSFNGFIAFSVCLLGCIFADFLSISQTRLFARTIQKFNDKWITAIFCISDITMSFTLFIFSYSLFQIFAYIIVIFSVINGSYTNNYTFAPVAIARIIDRYPSAREKLIRASKNPYASPEVRRLQLAYEVGRAYSKSSNLIIERIAKSHDQNGVEWKYPAVRYIAKKRCLSKSRENDILNFDNYSAFYVSNDILNNGLVGAGITYKDVPKFSIDLLKSSVLKEVNNSSECGLKVVTLSRIFDAKALTTQLSFLDMYLSSFSMTIYYSFSSISTKLSGYSESDLGESTKSFLTNAWMAKSQSFLGLRGSDRQAESVSNAIGSDNGNGEEMVKIPFTTFVVSSLMASAFLVFAVIIGWVSLLIAKMQRSVANIVDRNAFEKYVCAFSGAVIVIILFSVYSLWGLFDLIWYRLLGL